MNIVEPSVSLVWATPDAERIIERCARLCYKSEGNICDGSDAALIKKLIARGHEAMLEHCVASFHIVTDRGVTHEIVRHRIASYAQESTRYVSYEDGISVIKPIGLPETAVNGWAVACETANDVYCDMVRGGIAPQIARSVLPTCLKAEIIMTANFREWRHFIKLRAAPGAHPQMIAAAMEIKCQLACLAPTVFGDL